MSRTYVQSRDEILSRAFRICRVFATKQLPESDDIAQGAIVFNGLLNHLNAIDKNLWNKSWDTIPLVASSKVSNGGSYYRCIRGHTASAGDEPGVGTNWTSYWVLDSGASSGSVPWTVATAWVCAGDFVYAGAFSVAAAFLRYSSSDLPLHIRDYSEIFQVSTFPHSGSGSAQMRRVNLLHSGTPTELMVDPRTERRIFLSPIPNEEIAGSGVLHVLSINFLAECNAAGDNAPIPPEYQDAFVYMLAANLGDEYGVPLPRISRLEAKGRGLWGELNRSPHKEQTNDSKIKSCY